MRYFMLLALILQVNFCDNLPENTVYTPNSDVFAFVQMYENLPKVHIGTCWSFEPIEFDGTSYSPIFSPSGEDIAISTIDEEGVQAIQIFNFQSEELTNITTSVEGIPRLLDWNEDGIQYITERFDGVEIVWTFNPVDHTTGRYVIYDERDDLIFGLEAGDIVTIYIYRPDYLNIRSDHSLTADVIYEAELGGQAILIHGPVEEFVLEDVSLWWWQVSINNQLGWVVEESEDGVRRLIRSSAFANSVPNADY